MSLNVFTTCFNVFQKSLMYLEAIPKYVERIPMYINVFQYITCRMTWMWASAQKNPKQQKLSSFIDVSIYKSLHINSYSSCLYIIVATLANVTLTTSWLLHLAHTNKGLVVPTLHMPRTFSVSAHYQWHRPSSLIPFVPTS
jgi:hypothetical protein